jgi:corrinoid protein of di/trimethylamine methyltransferase
MADDLERQTILEKLKRAIVDFDITTVQEACKEALEKGIPAYDIVTQGMAKGMELVGQKYESGEFFISELIMAGETMKEGMKIVEPHLRSEEAVPRGKVVIGTVQGDLHDLGKNIVASLLKASGFRVIDVGFDVAPQRFVEETRNSQPNIVGMSALLTTTMVNIATTIRELRKAKLREQVKVIVGGAPISSEYARWAGADASADDAVKGVAICKRWTQAPQD